MDISATANMISQASTLYRNEPVTSLLQEQTQQTQSVEQVATEIPPQKIQKLNADIVNSRVAEHQASAAKPQLTADEAVGSLIDVCV